MAYNLMTNHNIHDLLCQKMSPIFVLKQAMQQISEVLSDSFFKCDVNKYLTKIKIILKFKQITINNKMCHWSILIH